VSITGNYIWQEKDMNITHFYTTLICLGMAFLVTGTSVIAGEKQTSISHEEASAILKELKNIRAVLERIEKNGATAARAQAPSAPVVASISSKDRPSMGKDKAPVTIVTVSDYQCPFCKRFADNTFKKLKKKYIDTGKVRFVFKDMPLPFHNYAKKAAQAAHCAGEQGKYWDMHDKLFDNTQKLDEKSLLQNAKLIKLDEKIFAECIASTRHMKAIDKDIADAGKAGLSGTPSFVIGKTTADVIKGEVVRGALPLSALETHIKKYL
jgi:protein-disulfide isomerase